MGRRKIEIQPITHERNRSVTFLKRKNGLFKKAYELGVLCSVDVAVIIFEERPSHHVKLYQYGSADIHDIVQRHLRHDGEKDTRGPADFSGNASTKLDDMGDADDDDQDDEDDVQSRSGRKRGLDGRMKPTQDLVSSMDYGPSGHRSLTIPQPLSMHGLAPSGGGGSTLPISSMREPTVSKRSRLGMPGSHSRSPSDDVAPPGSGTGPYSYHPGQNSAPFNRPSNSPYQHHTSQHHPSQHHPSQQHHQHHHGSQQQQQHHSNPQYQPFFSVSSHASPPPSFIPLQSDFSRGSGHSSRGGGSGSGGGGGPGFGLPTRTNSSGSSYETGLYPMIRPPPGSSSQSSGPGGGGGGGGGGAGGAGAGGGDLFAAFLDADEQTRHQSQSSQSSGFALDWPVHASSGGGGGNASGNSGAGGGGGGGGSSAPSGPSTSSSSVTTELPSLHAEAPGSGINASMNNISSSNGPCSGGGGGDAGRGAGSNWLDFLSPNSSNSGSGGGRDDSKSWERSSSSGHKHRSSSDMVDMFNEAGAGAGVNTSSDRRKSDGGSQMIVGISGNMEKATRGDGVPNDHAMSGTNERGGEDAKQEGIGMDG